MSNASFLAAMAPYARAQATATGLDCRLFLVQWAYESTWGTSPVSRNNNFAGIENSSGKGCTVCNGVYTCCPTVADFSALYTAIITDSTYATLRKAAGESLALQFVALGNSPWAAGHYEGSCGTPGCGLAELYHANQALFDAAGCQSVSPPPPPPGPTQSLSELLPALLIGASVILVSTELYRRKRTGTPLLRPGFA